MTEPHLLDRGFRSHSRNTKHFTVPLPFDGIKEARSREALGRESAFRAGEHWVFLPGLTHGPERRGRDRLGGHGDVRL